MISNQGSNGYVFASTRVRSVEKNLLTKERAENLIDCNSPEDAIKILIDIGYGKGAEEIEAKDFEKLLSEEIKKVYDFVRGIAPSEAKLYAFLYPYDYHNLKVLMKAEFLESDPEPYLIDKVGTIDVNQLQIMVRERNFVGMTDNMKNAILEVVDLFSRTNDPQVIDFIFDKYCYKEMKESADKTNNSYIKGYVSLLIDTINLKTFVRLREMKKNWDLFSQVFIEGGNIQDKLFISNYDEPYEQFAERLIPYGLSKAMAEGGSALRETGKFTVLEKLCDDSIMDYARRAKYVTFGIEPLAAYLIAKEAEIRTVRIVMTGLLQGLSREMMTERLRETYV
jgi:V/A-type H+-transporting ATPase subunit C